MIDERQHFLATVPLFASLASEELAIVAEMVTAVEWKAGADVFSMGAAGDSMFAVEEGVVEVYTVVSGIEKLFMTVRAGGVFGLLSLIDSGDQPGGARAVEHTRALALGRQSLDRLLEAHPGVGAKLLSGIGTTLGRQIRILVDQYRDTVAWNLEVTGLTSLNLERIMTERIQVAVETLRGEPLTGTLLRFEASAAGHELYLESMDKEIHVIPYHAIVRLSLDRSAVTDTEDTPIL
jgi:CRP-like cAMP-binding protein